MHIILNHSSMVPIYEQLMEQIKSEIINTALKEWKVISMPLGFLSDKNTAMICLMFITIWQGLGYYMMMYLAGLQGIPQELCEAATIDGANAVKDLQE